jgi:alpha-L-rhamnosidase
MIIHPTPGPGLDWARAEYRSVLGPVRSEWRRDGGRLIVTVTVPPNAVARVLIPSAQPALVSVIDEPGGEPGGGPALPAPLLRTSAAEYTVPSGTYRFATPWGPGL